jgi:hypothetical protein
VFIREDLFFSELKATYWLRATLLAVANEIGFDCKTVVATKRKEKTNLKVLKNFI